MLAALRLNGVAATSPTAIGIAAVPVGGSIDPSGLALLDDRGAAIVADPRGASTKYLAAIRLLASEQNLTEADLLATVGASTLAGHKAATSKRVQRALGGKRAKLYDIARGQVVMAPQTRQVLARYLGLIP
jgi:hypothetical protein